MIIDVDLDLDLDPTLDSETGKVRPAIVVTNDVYNQRVLVIQVVPITAWNEQKGRGPSTARSGRHSFKRALGVGRARSKPLETASKANDVSVRTSHE